MNKLGRVPLPALLCFWAFFASAWVSGGVFERLPHLEDELAYLYQARVFARGMWTLPTPDPRLAYWQPFLIDDPYTEQRFSKYAPGWSGALALGEAAGQVWVVNALFAALNVALVYRLGASIFNRDAGRIAALLLAFAPIALLLNGTLMGHTAALTYALVFALCYWRWLHSGGVRVALLAGVALGLLLVTRPLTFVIVALPFVAWSGVRLLHSWHERTLGRTLRPLLLLAVVALLIGGIIPLYNWLATSNPSENLYTRIWAYDRVGFGACCGRNGHTLEKGFRHARFDLSLLAADLWGWQLDPITPELVQHLRAEADYWDATGLSFVPLLLGAAGAMVWAARRKWTASAWWAGALLWCVLPVAWLDVALTRDATFAWAWVGAGVVWLLLPMLWRALRRGAHDTRQVAALLLVAWCGLIIVVQMAYWIGSQRYSTRYWYEAIGAAAVLSALPFAWVMARLPRWRVGVYALLLSVCVFSLWHYSTPRLNALYQFNNVSQAWLARVSDQPKPLLLLVNGASGGVSWRAYGTFLGVTSPFLDSEIVVARDVGGMRERILARFPNYHVLEAYAEGEQLTFEE